MTEAVDALEEAVRVWQSCRAPEVANAIDVLAASAESHFDAPNPRSKADYRKTWLELARSDTRALVTGFLANTLTHRLSIGGGDVPSRDRELAFVERLQALKDRDPDPRISRALTRVLSEAPFRPWGFNGNDNLYGEILRQIVSIGDVRQRPLLEDLLATPRTSASWLREWLAERLPLAITGLSEIRTDPPPDAGRWRAITSPNPELAAISESDLLAAIYATPDDDGPRLVYADYLMQRGDTRGEFIALQLARSRKGEPSKREKALLKAHRAQWLGADLESVLDQVVFERGFLASAVLAQNASASPEIWERASRDARLATLHTLGKGPSNNRHLASFLTSPAAQNLRRVEVASSQMLAALLSETPPRQLQHIALLFAPKPALISSLSRHASLSGLHSLTISAWMLPLSPLLSGLSEITWPESLRSLQFALSGDYSWTLHPGLLARLPPAIDIAISNQFGGSLSLSRAGIPHLSSIGAPLRPIFSTLAALKAERVRLTGLTIQALDQLRALLAAEGLSVVIEATTGEP